MSTLFTKIIQGAIPSYKIYEDDHTYAFLDIAPEAPGHTLIVPKVEVDKIYDLSDADYSALMATVKKLARHYENVLGERMMFKVVGVDVPHAHVHLLPLTDPRTFKDRLELSEAEMIALQEKLRLTQ